MSDPNPALPILRRVLGADAVDAAKTWAVACAICRDALHRDLDKHHACTDCAIAALEVHGEACARDAKNEALVDCPDAVIHLVDPPP